MKLSKILLIVAGILIAVPTVILAVASFKPDEFRVTRSITINKAPAEVFPLVNVVRNGEKWGPWFGLDPKMKTTYEGPESGVGAKYSWEGDDNVGAGNCTTTEVHNTELVRQRLEFIRPFAGVNTVDFTFRPDAAGHTVVTWTMYGPNNLMGKTMSLFMDCDKMCGDMFLKGLAKMKDLAEGTATASVPSAN